MALSTHKPENSSFLAGATYDDATGAMEITFKDGHTVTYRNVPQAVYEGLKATSSAGKYWHRQIKGRYAEDRGAG